MSPDQSAKRTFVCDNVTEANPCAGYTKADNFLKREKGETMFEFLLQNTKARKITPREVKDLLSSGKKIVLLDVRSPEEYREVHIPHSISLPLDELKTGITKAVPKKDAEIVTYCLSGMRAAQACRELADLGYTNVCNMGGIRNWSYETERG